MLFLCYDVTELFYCVMFTFSVVLREVIQLQHMSGSRKTMRMTG